MPNRSRTSRKPSTPRPSTHSPQAPLVFEPVDPAWILKALGVMLALALLFGYATLCAVFSHSQWQIVLHPSRTIATTPAALGLAFTEVHFDADASGQPQLDGWWIPAIQPGGSSPTQAGTPPTALILHGANGSMADALPQAQLLHNAGLNVLLFDYRGFGRSTGFHPTQTLMQADTRAAFDYLTATRHIPPASIIAFGQGLGASLAAQLCALHPQIPALILDSPDGDLAPRVRADTRSHLLPFGLLFHEDFALAAPLHTLATPKLILTSTPSADAAALQSAAPPKTILALPSPADTAATQQAIRRFLDTYGPSISTPPAIGK